VVSWEEHAKWFEATFRENTRKMFIVLVDEEPAGQVRFDRQGDAEAVVSAYLLESFTGKGYGVEAIRLACREILGCWSIKRILAFVRQDNSAAQKAFSKAGFIEMLEEPSCPPGHCTFCFSMEASTQLSAENPGPPMKTRWNQDDDSNIKLYTQLAKKHGIDVRSLNWGSQKSQYLRFGVLNEVGQLAGSTVLDVGCGLGDFLLWLQRARITVDYLGIDITPAMIELAQKRMPDGKFQVANLLAQPGSLQQQYDFVFASGVFTHRQQNPTAYLQDMVRAMFARCRRALAFNSLSLWAPQQDAGEFYADPLATLEFCRTLTPWVTLRHDYMPHDLTIYLYREQHLQ
jgi:SAM-dependent methyltransferase